MDSIVKKYFPADKISAYEEVRDFRTNLGDLVEDYINTKLPPHIKFVGRKRGKKRPLGVDYIDTSTGIRWQVKNSYHTENNAQKVFREDRDIQKWHRLNADDSTNWHTCFVEGLSEEGFCDFLGVDRPSSLDEFFV